MIAKPIRVAIRPEASTERSLHATAPAAMTCFKIPIRLSAYRNAGLSVQRAELIDANALRG
ncbi:MAG TPA: hypothetical protein VNA66_03105, partial [Gammaproteobacteria bacterium]|nr:hypothetical protein [Gammaproteobacteria bacterium]